MFRCTTVSSAGREKYSNSLGDTPSNKIIRCMKGSRGVTLIGGRVRVGGGAVSLVVMSIEYCSSGFNHLLDDRIGFDFERLLL